MNSILTLKQLKCIILSLPTVGMYLFIFFNTFFCLPLSLTHSLDAAGLILKFQCECKCRFF